MTPGVDVADDDDNNDDGGPGAGAGTHHNV